MEAYQNQGIQLVFSFSNKNLNLLTPMQFGIDSKFIAANYFYV
ncbi:hypothetical protein NARC_40056 [Candidatus Nitrosocosmicus arcticus]|uniref:Uncharacterized protein n=1 Tax=Candidatus Nitrosocosmicus arcticus TaxID=2035267 RepID=A0A557SWW1_9ARCH|nr:hypothetical protein NARC_40056 [Candidatus Nitrosocosmicus arcticus]